MNCTISLSGNELHTISKVYIVAPAQYASGGPELLHQLGAELINNGITAYMYYVPSCSNPVHPSFTNYSVPYIGDIEDSPSNLLIVPETCTTLLNKYPFIKKAIWWLSVDNYFTLMPGLKGKINRCILNKFNSQGFLFFDRRLLPQVHFHLYQSYYAMQLLSRLGVKNKFFLGDYVDPQFYSQPISSYNRKDVVLYNPSKGSHFTSQLINAGHGRFKFYPLTGLQRDQVIQLLATAKVYIDFGNHPGKDRIPREAASMGCCVITSTNGSAANNIDIPISDIFKFNNVKSSNDGILFMIEQCIANYQYYSSLFNIYREAIKSERVFFCNSVNSIFST